MLGRFITLGAVHGADRSLAGYAALQLLAYFTGGALFERIGATACHERTSKENQDRQGLHLPILRSEHRNASRCSGARRGEGRRIK